MRHVIDGFFFLRRDAVGADSGRKSIRRNDANPSRRLLDGAGRRPIMTGAVVINARFVRRDVDAGGGGAVRELVESPSEFTWPERQSGAGFGCRNVSTYPLDPPGPPPWTPRVLKWPCSCFERSENAKIKLTGTIRMKSNDIKVYSFRIDGKELKRTIGDESGTDHEE